MADNFVQWSQQISNLTDEEIAWLKGELKTDPSELDDDALEAWKASHPDIDPDFWPEFSYDIDEKDRTFWFYGADCGNLENLASLVHEFLKRFRPSQHVRIEWACTCSKPRLDEFWGGAMVITAEEIISKTTGEVVNEILTDLKRDPTNHA